MRTYLLRVNFNHLRKEIDNHYFLYRDIFYRCFIASLYECYLNDNSIFVNTIIDNPYYSQYFINAINKASTLVEVLNDLNISKYVNIFLELDVYVDEFIKLKHSPFMINVYSLDISDNFYIEVKNKHIKRENVTKNLLS